MASFNHNLIWAVDSTALHQHRTDDPGFEGQWERMAALQHKTMLLPKAMLAAYGCMQQL